MKFEVLRLKRARTVANVGVLFITLLGAILLWSSSPRTPNLPPPPLKDLAASHEVKLGNYAALKRLHEKPYSDILTSQYEFLSVDGELNWTFNDGSLRPSEGTYNFRNPDKVFAFARAHNMPVQGHHLVWGEEKWLPDWLKNGHYTKDQLSQLIHQHIATVGAHYKGQVREWSVVNEPFSRNLHINGLSDWWADHTGGMNYIDQSFAWARQADPTAKLLINDFNNEDINGVSNAEYASVKGMKQRGVPLDGIGMQMHIEGSRPPKKENVIKNMQRFAKLGLKIYVTEFDVNMSNVAGTQEQRDKIESNIYRDMTRACIESKVCPSFAELGITDKDSWYNEIGIKNAYPLPFDGKYRPKPAFYALREALGQN